LKAVSTYPAQEAGEFLPLDTSSVVDAPPSAGVISLNDKLLTQPTGQPSSSGRPACWRSYSR
jgi:hypothetical protein